MIDLSSIDGTKLGGNVRLMSQEFQRRGWRAFVPYEGITDGLYNVFIDRGDGRLLQIFSAAPPTTSYAAGYLTDNKFATLRFLEHIGVKQMDTILINMYDQAAKEFMDRYERVVVKPLDSSHGNGVRIDIRTADQAKDAIAYASQYATGGQVLMQKQFVGSDIHDIRITVLNGECMGAVERVPAKVTGDGVSTIGQLIVSENTTVRGEPYVMPLARIDITQAKKYLGTMIDNIPMLGERVQVIGAANYGAGGELVDITDRLPDWMREEAEYVAQQTGLVAAGVDYMVSGEVTPHLKDTLDDAMLIEINKNPALYLNDLANGDMQYKTIARYIDYLASLD